MLRLKPKADQTWRFIEPMHPKLAEEPPTGLGWSHEIKYDGYRTQIQWSGDVARAYTRNGFDWSDRYALLLTATRSLRSSSAIVDGEVIVQDQQGRSDFRALRAALSGEPHRLIYYAFDLLELDGKDLRKHRLDERRDRLESLIGAHDPEFPIQFSTAVVGAGVEMLQAACGMGLEGIVSKRLDSRYVSGRQTSWLKIKCYDESELVVIGAEHEAGKPAFALLAREEAGDLLYAGSAFVTLGDTDRERFWNSIETHTRSAPVIPMPKGKARRWSDPVLRVRVQHLKGEGKLRHATIRELL